MMKQGLRTGLALLFVVTGTSLIGAATAAPVDSDETGFRGFALIQGGH